MEGPPRDEQSITCGSLVGFDPYPSWDPKCLMFTSSFSSYTSYSKGETILCFADPFQNHLNRALDISVPAFDMILCSCIGHMA